MATPATTVTPTPAPVDTSAAALERNELGIKNNIQQAPAFSTTPAPEVTPAQGTNVPPVDPVPETPVESPKQEEKLWAGKYKSPEELEKGYVESQKGFMSKVQQEAAKLAETKAAEIAEAKVKEKLQSLAQGEQSAQAVATQAMVKPLAELTDDEILDLQVKSPQEFIRRTQQEIQERTMRAIRAAQVQEDFKRTNQDLLSTEIDIGDGKKFNGEFMVSAMAMALAKERPELLQDGTGEAILRESAGAVRNLFSTIRNQGKQEALVVRETVAPLQATVSPVSAPPSNPSQAAVQNADPLDEEVERRRAELKRVSGSNAVVRY